MASFGIVLARSRKTSSTPQRVNYLHPFREGNGRTQRIFWTQIAGRAGYQLDWRKTTGMVNDKASRNAMEGRDFSGLRAMFDTIVKPASRIVGKNNRASDNGPGK